MVRTAPLCAAFALVSIAVPCFAGGADFSYNPPGSLVPGSGEGRVDDKVYAPEMRFPIEEGPAFANSQVWGIGGSNGPAGSQCADGNFSYPWSDNYCETRTWDMPLCPSGTGHQGQDIRAASCDKDVYWVVAAETGTVTNVGSYSVYITAADGTRYDYLHMGSVQVAVGDEVQKGEHIGKVSNVFGGTPTSVHLHFNLRQNVASVGNVYVPPYLSLVGSYQALVGPPPTPAAGALDETSCETLRGWTQSPADPEVPIDVRLYFDGAPDDAGTVGYPFLADLERDDLCAALGSCNHAFELPPPLALFDGLEHQVRAYASDGSPTMAELGGSPSTFTCAFEIPPGVRRNVRSLESANAWRFSPFWDEIAVSDGVLASLEEGEQLADAPRVVANAADPTALFIVDGGKLRAVASSVVARAWHLDPGFAEQLSEDELAALPQGEPLPARPTVLRSASGELWLVDAPDLGGGAGGAGAGGGGAGPESDDDSGCGCALPAGPGGGFSRLALGLLATLLVGRRFRRN